MSAKIPEKGTRKIAVILGASGSGKPLLNILQQLLGKAAEANLHGVFIEDDELRHVAAFPFAKEICRLTLSIREIQDTRFDRTIALRLRSARSTVEALARRMGISHTFREARGSTVSLLRETVHSADITVFDPSRKLATGAISPALHGGRSPRRIVVVMDDSETGKEALLTAILLANGETHRVSNILRAESAAQLEALQTMAANVLPGSPNHLLLLPDHGIQQLVTTVIAERADMLVLGASEKLLKPEPLGLLLKQLECPICVVRQLYSEPTKPIPEPRARHQIP